ncbi:glycerate kinase [Brooklawnia cerclae]|uniref:Glycerate kinase n=1 Tax=Brooklawnia cerclae TaxID=349934 RepID=A0ABX0SIC4_9ACTN|nr:glycerate kinase [Brooklawnia cerclae]NIH58137.1 glycerate kinase [Brooklawnia cerclae]
MRIICAPDSFKGSMTAPEAASIMARAARACLPDARTVELPIADGGEGFTEAVSSALDARIVPTRTHDQEGRPHDTAFGLVDTADGRVALLDVASTSGLELVPAGQRHVIAYSSRGLGELIGAALDTGAKRLVIGIGGSSTNEAGAGMLAALGVRFFDADGQDIEPTPDGLRGLAEVDASGIDPRLADVEVEVASDVTNPLLGPQGASAVYGPQKGADDEQVAELDRILAHLVEVCRSAAPGGRDATLVAQWPGAGAAGGIGWALQLFLGGRLRPGLELVAELAGLDEHLRDAGLLLTGEGSVDAQTCHGKAIHRLCEHASKAGVPVLVFAGRVGIDAGLLPGDVTLVQITPSGMPLDDALRRGPENLRLAVTGALGVLAEELSLRPARTGTAPPRAR